MLVLSRKTTQSLIIGNDIKITILASHGNQVRLGIDAPKQIGIYREEIYERFHNVVPQTQDQLFAEEPT